MNKQSKYLRKSDVIMVWKCPDCGKFCRVATSWTEKNGTPQCVECDVDCVFSHVLVKRSLPKRVVVKWIANESYAILGNRKSCVGKFPNAAIGALVREFPEEFGVKIV